jgi:hypothetical protein
MSDQYFLIIDTSTGEVVRKQAIQTSAGAGDANKIARTDSSGKFDSSLVPNVTEPVETIVASSTISNQSLVNIHDVSGTRNVRPALAADATKPVHGYVETGVSGGASATVKLAGLVTFAIGSTGIVAADVGDPVFLSASTDGAITKTPPASTGNVIQRLGTIIEVDTGGGTFRVDFDPQPGITL